MRHSANLLIIDGGTVKTSEEGIVEGLGIVFGSESEPDQSAQRDFFTKDSFIRKKESFSVPLYYEHGFGAIDTEIGEATLTKTDDGWSATAIIDTTDEIGKKVYEAVKDKPHGFSTGALQHLVKREARSNDTNFLKQWVVGELSLTERPAERKAVVQYVKSVDGELVVSTAWEKEDESLSVVMYDEEGHKIWDSADKATKSFPEETPFSIELKSAYGSTVYNMSLYNDDGSGFYVSMEEWGNIEDLIQKLESFARTARSESKNDVKTADPEEKDLEKRVRDLVDSILKEKESPCDKDDEECDEDEWKSELEDVKKELADLKSELSDRDDALTKANEEIARLEILAGAKETIEKNKGK